MTTNHGTDNDMADQPIYLNAVRSVAAAADEDARLIRADCLRVAAEAFGAGSRPMWELLWAAEWLLGDFIVNAPVDQEPAE